MKHVLLILNLLLAYVASAQDAGFPKHLQKTQIAALKSGDSLVYYQCHVDEASQEIVTSTGQKITAKKKRLTITEKFVIHKVDSVYNCKYFTSSVTNYPNKKFPYLTLTEVQNWDFELKKNKPLTTQEVLVVAALETKTHSIVHYELNINKTCPNEIIICSKKDKEQFMVEGNYLLSKLLNCQ
jgi:hypothetical protein